MTIAYVQTRVDRIKELADEIAAYTPDAEQGTPAPETPQPIVSGLLDIVTIASTGNVKYMGNLDRCLARSYWEATQRIADALRKQFPNRAASKLEMVRACPKVDTKPDTHFATGYMADFHYFTFGETNHTQVGAFSQPLIEIWKDGELTDLFDAERTLSCMEMFKTIFPLFKVATVPKIKEAMGAMGRAYDWIGASLDQPNMYHDTHWHGAIIGGGAVVQINTGAVI